MKRILVIDNNMRVVEVNQNAIAIPYTGRNNDISTIIHLRGRSMNINIDLTRIAQDLEASVEDIIDDLMEKRLILSISTADEE